VHPEIRKALPDGNAAGFLYGTPVLEYGDEVPKGNPPTADSNPGSKRWLSTHFDCFKDKAAFLNHRGTGRRGANGAESIGGSLFQEWSGSGGF
jgi:hypothetical protein